MLYSGWGFSRMRMGGGVALLSLPLFCSTSHRSPLCTLLSHTFSPFAPAFPYLFPFAPAFPSLFRALSLILFPSPLLFPASPLLSSTSLFSPVLNFPSPFFVCLFHLCSFCFYYPD